MLADTDYLKIAHPLGWGASNLVLSMLEFKQAYQAAGQWDIAVRNIKWAADWLVKAHLKASDNAKENVFVGQVGAAASVVATAELQHAGLGIRV